MKLKLGFDEVYIVTENGVTLDCETIYDSITADEKVKELQNSGYTKAEKFTLESFLNIRELSVKIQLCKNS